MELLPIEILLDPISRAKYLQCPQFSSQIIGTTRVDGDGASSARTHVYGELVDYSGAGDRGGRDRGRGGEVHEVGGELGALLGGTEGAGCCWCGCGGIFDEIVD
jgi:hypothetical protein